jgi:hypothetical protein
LDKEKNIKAFLKLMGKDLRASNINFEIIQDDKDLNINELKIGLVSGFSVWSGYTFGIGKKVINELSDEMVKNEIPIYLLDCDFVSVELQKKLFKTSSWGYFESCWVEIGEIQKRYKYKYELNPFLFFVKNRLKEISGYFENKIIKSYILNQEKQKLGIEDKDFISQKEAIILSKSKYKNQFLYELMEYQEKGHYYLYEDDIVTIYEETTPTHLSSCFLRIKDKKEGST